MLTSSCCPLQHADLPFGAGPRGWALEGVPWAQRRNVPVGNADGLHKHDQECTNRQPELGGGFGNFRLLRTSAYALLTFAFLQCLCFAFARTHAHPRKSARFEDVQTCHVETGQQSRALLKQGRSQVGWRKVASVSGTEFLVLSMRGEVLPFVRAD